MYKYGGDFELDDKSREIEVLKKEVEEKDIWSNASRAEEATKKLNYLSGLYDSMIKIKSDIDVLMQYQEFGEDIDESMKTEFENLYDKVLKELKEKEIYTYLSGEYDDSNVIFEIHAGAGGTESCDWAMMLNRMYLRYFDKKDYKYEKIYEQPGEEVGIKSVSYIVKGKFAYGYLKNEKGVHRLVRLSPFDANHKRHTSFAAVDVIPEINNDIVIDIKENDLKIDVYRSSGAGGQGVNTTDSAVRVTHIPTGIVVTCQNERSQIKNKETAIEVLKSKLYQLKIKEQEEDMKNIRSDHNKVEFGSQIRSYVMHPYSLVKDHRTNYETSNVDKVLDGNIDEFIEAELKG